MVQVAIPSSLLIDQAAGDFALELKLFFLLLLLKNNKGCDAMLFYPLEHVPFWVIGV